jgi:hypothetical protein
MLTAWQGRQSSHPSMDDGKSAVPLEIFFDIFWSKIISTIFQFYVTAVSPSLFSFERDREIGVVDPMHLSMKELLTFDALFL